MIQLTTIENAWDAFSVFGVFVVGFVIMGLRPFSAVSTKASLGLYFWHTLFCVYYLYYSLDNPADATGYFRKSFDLPAEFTLGNTSIYYLTAFCTQVLNLSYLGSFLFYNILGTFGLLAFYAALNEALTNKSKNLKQLASIVVFFPGLSFWSSAIGKDTLTFLGSGLLCWSLLNGSRRYPAAIAGIMLFMFPRAYMVGLLVASLAISVLIAGRMKVSVKIVALAVIVPAVGFALTLSMSAANIGSEGAFDSIGDLISYQQTVNNEGGSSISLVDMNIAMRYLSYAFRPLFFDAGSMLGLVASFENLIIIGIFCFGTLQFRKSKSSLPPVARWFYAIYVALAWTILANSTANIGLATRQKWMFMPMLLLLMLTYFPNINHLIKRRNMSPRQGSEMDPTRGTISN